MQRDKSTREDARTRLQAQLPIADKLEYADIVVDNSGTPAELEIHVDEFARRLYLEGGWSWRLKWLIPPLGLFSAMWTLIWRRVKRRRCRGERQAQAQAGVVCNVMQCLRHCHRLPSLPLLDSYTSW
jgi:dephospho-CoA kinase